MTIEEFIAQVKLWYAFVLSCEASSEKALEEAKDEYTTHRERRAVYEAQVGRAFGASLIMRKEAVEEWAKEMAKSRNGRTEHDWDYLLRSFFPFHYVPGRPQDIQMPDVGRLVAAVHSLLDHYGGLPPVAYTW